MVKRVAVVVAINRGGLVASVPQCMLLQQGPAPCQGAEA
jgi:hypothetical protein